MQVDTDHEIIIRVVHLLYMIEAGIVQITKICGDEKQIL